MLPLFFFVPGVVGPLAVVLFCGDYVVVKKIQATIDSLFVNGVAAHVVADVVSLEVNPPVVLVTVHVAKLGVHVVDAWVLAGLGDRVNFFEFFHNFYFIRLVILALVQRIAIYTVVSVTLVSVRPVKHQFEGFYQALLEGFSLFGKGVAELVVNVHPLVSEDSIDLVDGCLK